MKVKNDSTGTHKPSSSDGNLPSSSEFAPKALKANGPNEITKEPATSPKIKPAINLFRKNKPQQNKPKNVAELSSSSEAEDA